MKIIVVLGLNLLNNAMVIIKARSIIGNMTNNPFFSAQDIVDHLAVLANSVDVLEALIIAPITESKTDGIRTAREVVDRHLGMLASKVQATANNPLLGENQRVDAVHSAGLEVKQYKKGDKRSFTVSNGEKSGSAYIVAGSSDGKAKAHEWQYVKNPNANGEGERIAAPTTTTAFTEINNLEVGSRIAFYHKAILAGKQTNWEGPIFWVIQ
ncbi:hypothetical protein WSM22_32880 [Cytophagales bacterium WSM2-2]|nr:hypothetical protein WSM22_32880 [Cytophagales bacterium WSM2-2]